MLSMPLRSKTNIMVDRVPVACNFKLPWQGCFRWHTFPSLSSLECICCTSRWVQAHRVYWRILLATRNSFPEREYSSGQPVSLSRKDLILVEFNLASFSQDHQIANSAKFSHYTVLKIFLTLSCLCNRLISASFLWISIVCCWIWVFTSACMQS